MQGVFEHLHAAGIKAPEPVGLQVMVHGVVPLGGWRGRHSFCYTVGLPVLSPLQPAKALLVLDAGWRLIVHLAFDLQSLLCICNMSKAIRHSMHCLIMLHRDQA